MNDRFEAQREISILTVHVNPARLKWGRYDHERGQDIGEGDIHASYSADTIAIAGKVRKSFRFQGRLLVTVSMSGCGGVEKAEAFELIPPKTFNGIPTPYHERTGTADNADAARNDPMGFYHGMKVTCGRETFIMSGPPTIFEADPVATRPNGYASDEEPEQLHLY